MFDILGRDPAVQSLLCTIVSATAPDLAWWFFATTENAWLLHRCPDRLSVAPVGTRIRNLPGLSGMVREKDDSYWFGALYPTVFSPIGRARRFSGESEMCASGGRVSLPCFQKFLYSPSILILTKIVHFYLKQRIFTARKNVLTEARRDRIFGIPGISIVCFHTTHSVNLQHRFSHPDCNLSDDSGLLYVDKWKVTKIRN